MNDPGLCVLRRSLPRSRRKGAANGSKRSLELFLLALSLLSSLTGTASTRVQNPHKEKLNEILGASVLLPVNIPATETLKTVEWYFQGENGLRLQLAEFREERLQRPNPRDRFGPRLEMANETTLRIKDLEMDDSGKYSIIVKFTSAQYEDYTFHLSVYEPVPEPKILSRLVSNSPDGCNVTLQCQVPEKGKFNISWKRGDAFRDLEDASKSYHLSGNGRNLHLFWKLNSSDPNITCLVTNPADQKSISSSLLDICQTESDKQLGLHWSWSWSMLIIFFIILLLLSGLGLKTWKKRRKMPLNRATSMMPTEESLPEPQYSEVAKRSPPEGDDDQEHGHLHDPTVSFPTVYVKLQLPARHSEQVT
ncbi:SLAM family member 9-like [Lacerta agilis]|uniref:SLAM family member 9-like n=1 Tax=Lacerta agilis TaxID=80427 RepID=UPI0014197B92|nr:SLAM family member 9-like [Lacerta agilis]